MKLINVAIDDKSPYTGGHCGRVYLRYAQQFLAPRQIDMQEPVTVS